MEPLHDHGAPQVIWDFISIEVFFHTVSACASNLLQRIEIMVYVPVSFLVAYFWIQQGSLQFNRKKTSRQTDRQTNAKRTLDSYQVWSIF